MMPMPPLMLPPPENIWEFIGQVLGLAIGTGAGFWGPLMARIDAALAEEKERKP